MGSFVAMDGKGNVEMRASGKLPAGTRFSVESVSRAFPEPVPNQFPMNVMHVASYQEVIERLKREKVRADTGHFPECKPQYPGGFCGC